MNKEEYTKNLMHAIRESENYDEAMVKDFEEANRYFKGFYEAVKKLNDRTKFYLDDYDVDNPDTVVDGFEELPEEEQDELYEMYSDACMIYDDIVEKMELIEDTTYHVNDIYPNLEDVVEGAWYDSLD